MRLYCYTRCSLYVIYCQAGVTASDIGVVAPYQQQVRLIRETLKTMHAPDCIEVNTVDQYQGRDKSAIVISFVRTVHTANNTQVCFQAAVLLPH